MNKLFSDWYDAQPSEPTYQVTFEAGQQAGVIELNRFKEFSKLAGRAMNDAHAVIDTIEGECFSEREKLSEVLNVLRDLTYQAYTLNGVMSAGQLKAVEGKS